jgi:cytoskeletal protein CcmA (bactofilin family)
MNSLPDENESGHALGDQLSTDLPALDLEAHFGEWLRAVENVRDELQAVPAESQNQGSPSRIYLESIEGSDCEISFEGALHFGGRLRGRIQSLGGTLIISEEAEIDGDIEVGIALIDGTVKGSITASESVMLSCHARILGQIKSSSLSITHGAVFEGDCVYMEETASRERRESRPMPEKEAAEREELNDGPLTFKRAAGSR